MVDGVTRIELPSRLGAAKATDFSAPSCFVAGPENRLATLAVSRLLQGETLCADGHLFNPLVLTGPSGSGKSHLAWGVVRRWESLLGADSIAYFTAADFARQLQAAREENVLGVFRDRLLGVQLFVLEDLQKLSHRTSVQRELRDAIDGILEAGGLVLIAAHVSPATLSHLELGLRDRLTAGLIVPIRSPELAARREILTLAADARRVDVPASRLQQIAQTIDGPAPRLFQALAQCDLAADQRLEPASTAQKAVRLKQVVSVVARYHSVTQAALCSNSRRKSLVQARGVVVHLARTLTDLSYAQIGRALGGRDHSTIMHAARTIRGSLANDTATQQTIDDLQRILTAP